MIQDEIIKQKSDSFAREVKGILKKYGLSVVDLDKKHKDFRCPDYFVQTKDKRYAFVCECKYIFSAGSLDSGKYQFVVALSFDFFADSFRYIPKDICGLKSVSALIRIKRDYEIKQALQKLSIEQLEQLISKKISIKLPQNTKRFRVLLNKNPNIKFPASKLLRNLLIN